MNDRYQIRVFKSGDLWYAELWIEIMDSKMYDFEDSVSSESYSGLQTEIGNKNWVDLLNK